MRKILQILMMFWALNLNAQNFHKIYLFEDTFAVIHNIYPTDSGYYFGVNTGRVGIRSDFGFGRLNLDGSVNFIQKYVTPNEDNHSMGGRTLLDTNYRGNLLFGYTIRQANGWFPHFTEVDFQGNIIQDFTLDFYETDSLDFYDYGRVLMSESDSSFYFAFSYYDNTTDDDLNHNGEKGTILGEINFLGDTLWTKRFADPSNDLNKPLWEINSLSSLTDSTLLISFRESGLNSSLPANTWSKIHFLEIELDGNIISDNIKFESTSDFSGKGVLVQSQRNIIYSHFNSILETVNGSSYWYDYFSVISLVDSNYTTLWTDTINPLQGNYWAGSVPQKMIFSSDTSFVGVYGYLDTTDVYYNYYSTSRLFNRDMEGEVIWERDYNFFYTPTDSAVQCDFELIDVQQTHDDGYIMCGQILNWDSLYNIPFKPGQFGYVIKTNCLGFLDDPQAAASYSIGDSNNVHFTNQSIMAGSYQWSFGDGDTLRTTEYVTNVDHTYNASGIFEVELVAYGCNGANDTLRFQIDFEYIPTEPIYEGDGTLLTLFPNPIQQGESLSFYIGAIDSTEHTIYVYDNRGSIVDSFKIITPKSTYFYPVDHSAGLYHFVLRKNGSILETEKLIVIQ